MPSPKVTILVEFFGVPRLRAGSAGTTSRLTAPVTLGDVIENLASRYPAFADDCLIDGSLRRDFVVNRNGRCFVDSPETLLADGDRLLIMSADAGG